jgi:CubicO group peptidase (beta-lactamase class C family)
MRRAFLLLAALTLAVPATLVAQADFIELRFERYLDALRRQAGIPGLTAVIVQNEAIAWETALGYQDVEAQVPATPDTLFYVADLTGLLSATLVLQCVEEGTLTLDQPVLLPSVGLGFPPASATVGELLRHVSPVEPFRYDPSRFAALTGAVAQCTAGTFRGAVKRRLLDRLAMTRTVPGLDVLTVPPSTPLVPSDVTQEELGVYNALLQQVAKPYRVDDRGRPSLSQLPGTTLDAAFGLVTTARDLARFSTALDAQVLLTADTLAVAWAPSQPLTGDRFGLGWFVQVYNGQPVVWHFGYAPGAGSALYIHLPARHKTLIMLANSDGLSAAFSLATGDVTTSPFARLFLSLFG